MSNQDNSSNEFHGNLIIDSESNTARLKVNTKIFSFDSVLSASYLFTENFFVHLDGDPEKEIIVSITPKKIAINIEESARNFFNELVNFSAYSKQLEKNMEMRKIILQRILATNSEDDDMDDMSAIEDPEGIAIPWEEKYGTDDEKL